ncbi:MAG: hypothetical protein HYZ28_13195 [Myxococcales bacterium]|nr:hypothetical protein [Myxococcales bacterium]
MRPTGKVNYVTLALIVAALGGIYWVIFFAPVYLDNMDVKEAIEAAYNQSSQLGDDPLRKFVLDRVNSSQLGNHREDDGYGNVKVVGGLGIKPEQITIERNEVTRRIRIQVEYAREVVLKPTSRVRTVRFRPQKEAPFPATK